jgi:crossover junction endodeoxyribonuclease RusA
MRHILHLPYPPSINNYWIASGHRRFVSKRGRDFKLAVQEYVAVQQLESFGGAIVEVNIILRPRNLKLMDIDNCVKPILDALQDAGLFDDDKQVGHVSVRRGIPIAGGKCIVAVELLSAPESSEL